MTIDSWRIPDAMSPESQVRAQCLHPLDLLPKLSGVFALSKLLLSQLELKIRCRIPMMIHRRGRESCHNVRGRKE